MMAINVWVFFKLLVVIPVATWLSFRLACAIRDGKYSDGGAIVAAKQSWREFTNLAPWAFLALLIAAIALAIGVSWSWGLAP